MNALCGYGYRYRMIALGLLLLGAANILEAAVPSTGRLTLTTRKAVVFKDGYALLIKEAKGVADASGRVHMLEVPDSAVLGSFWAIGEKQNILAMRAEFTEDWKRQDTQPIASVTSLSALLNRARGKKVSMYTAEGKQVQGRYLGDTAIDNEPHVLIRTHGEGGEKSNVVTLAKSSIASLGILRGDAAELVEAKASRAKLSSALAVNAGRIKQIASAGAEPQFERAKRLSFDLGKEAAEKPVKLTLMYFTPGIRWIPTYRLTGELKDSTRMALQAEILNQCEPLEGVALDLVVGVPHFRFRDVISPLSLEATLRNALAQAAPQLMGQMSNAMFTQRSGEWRGHGDTASQPTSDVTLPSALTATGEHDLFVYSVPKFSLGMGGRATVPLWQAEAPLRHLYTLDLHVRRHAHYGNMVSEKSKDGRYPAGSPLRLLKTQVWHQLELTNKSKVPWTTGAAMIMRGQLPMGQDLLTYAPPGGRSLLPMTVAINLRGTLREEEIERKPNVLRWGSHSYSQIRKKGTITLTSYREQASDMRIGVSLAGHAEKVSEDAEVSVDDFHPGDWHDGGFWMNNHSELAWDLTLKPGETRTLHYEVTFYVP